jgi:hypothetical protein
MKALCSLVCGILCIGSSSVLAEEAVGRVRALYFEAARNVLLEHRVQRAPASARLWADVELTAVLDTEKRRVLVQIPPELRAVPGDVVAVNIEEAQVSRTAASQVPMLPISRVTEVRSRAFAGLGAAE